jgi:hypothetical protein
VLYSQLVNGCYRPTNAFQVGALVTPSDIFQDEACTAATLNADVNYYALGSPLGLQAFPLIELVREGKGRLRALNWAFGATSHRSGDSFFDTELSTSCVVAGTADGTLRCFVDGPFVQSGFFFSDDQCAEALDWLYSGGCNPVFNDGDLEYERDYATCAPVVLSARELLTHSGPVYTGTPDDCVVAEPGAIIGRVFVDRGDDVPLERFAEVERVLE